MPFVLHTQAPAGYFHHNSGGEHLVKHIGDTSDINELRLQRGEEPFSGDELTEMMYGGGVVTIREYLTDSFGAGDIAGYGVADKSGGVIDVKDIYVTPEHRSRGLAGSIIGILISRTYINVRGSIMSTNYGNTLRIQDEEYRLPGQHLELLAAQSESDDAMLLRAAMPKGWSGLLDLPDDTGKAVCEVYQDGEVVGNLDHVTSLTYTVRGSEQVYEHAAFAATALLNQGKKLPQKM